MWPAILQIVAPAGERLIEYVVGLIQKEAKGQPVTPEDWRGLGQLHTATTLAQAVKDAAAK